MSEYECQYKCGTKIHFENSIRSSTGKQIPLEPDGKPHQCPNKPNPWNGKQKPATKQDDNQTRLNAKLQEVINKLKAIHADLEDLMNNG